jgi:hypothetical protein
MVVTLNEPGFDHSRKLIKDGEFVFDDRDAWSEHQPNAEQENRFIEEHGYREYGRWHLGIDDEMNEDTKGRYKFPYGDFEKVHRCGVLSAEVRAAQNDYTDIQLAVAHLHGMLEAVEPKK